MMHFSLRRRRRHAVAAYTALYRDGRNCPGSSSSCGEIHQRDRRPGPSHSRHLCGACGRGSAVETACS